MCRKKCIDKYLCFVFPFLNKINLEYRRVVQVIQTPNDLLDRFGLVEFVGIRRWYYNMHDYELDLIELCCTRICIIRCAWCEIKPCEYSVGCGGSCMFLSELIWERSWTTLAAKRHYVGWLLIPRLLIINDSIDNSPIMRTK